MIRDMEESRQRIVGLTRTWPSSYSLSALGSSNGVGMTTKGKIYGGSQDELSRLAPDLRVLSKVRNFHFFDLQRHPCA